MQEVGNATTMSIPTRITARKSQPFSTTYRNHYRPGGSNILNLKNIVIHKPNACITKSSKSHLPSFCCINARSLLPKIDELTSFLSCRQPSVVAVTESWLNSDIEDGLVSINGYNIFRKDRPSRRGGGICVYLPHGTYAKRRLDLEHENLECLWLWLRPAVECYQVCKKLQSVHPFKAPGPDNISPRILKEYAHMLAEPITIIFNTSLASGVVPSSWKESNIVPIPKTSKPIAEADTRPISLTSFLSKVLEDFVVSWLIEDVKEKIDPRTTFCLLDMLHTWLSHLDGLGNHLRICFLDFSKAFDRIGYNLLIEKLVNLGARRSLIPWIINFLSNRKQRVKFDGAISDWLPVNAGVPQGTKLGPILFLVMVNNLRITSPDTRMWKYVDDVSTSESLSRNCTSITQSTLNSVQLCASDNWMKLNIKKCKELRVGFLGETPQLMPLLIDGHPVETVRSHKVLGLTIQNNLKWDEHIYEIVSKASKRLHILRVLRRSGIPSADLLTVYIALIRSILEYSCEVWHSSISCYLSDKLEKIQKRALGIIYPEQTYKDALLLAGITKLETIDVKIYV